MASRMADPNVDKSYSRRLDRTPETDKSNLARLSENDRSKIYGLRSAFGNTMNKLQKLEESNDEKDLMIERERQLRKNLEDKLMDTKLVDMYSDPAVNEELHERLPRAAKERMYSVQGTPRTSRSKSKQRRRKGARSEEDRSASDSETHNRGNHRHNYSYPGGSMYPFPNPYHTPGMFGWSPGMMYPPQFTQHSTPNPESSTNQPPPFAGYHPAMPSQWFSNNTQNTGLAGNNVTGAQHTLPGATSVGVTSDEINVIKAASMLSADSKERQISRLLHEIELIRDQNRKITDSLSEQITECNRLKIENELRAASLEEQSSSKVSELIQEIYAKQKQRDKAMMGRLKLANEERDKAVLLVTSLKRGQNLADLLSDDEEEGTRRQSRENVLSGLDIKTGDVLEAIHGSTQRTREGYSRRLDALTSERDSAHLKVQQLEMELLSAQRQIDEITPIQEEQLKLKRQLSMTQQERDMVLTKLRGLEEENNNLKIYYGLHKSLSKEQSWKEQYNNSLNQMQQLIAQRDGTVIDAQKETNKLQEIIQELTEERDSLTLSLEKLQTSETDHQKTNEKLQRHVSVLQKKLMRISHGDQGTV